MKKIPFLLIVLLVPASAQRPQDVQRDLSRIEDKIDQLQFDQDRRARQEEDRKQLAEENRLLALPLDEDLKGFLGKKYTAVLGDSRLSQQAKVRLLRGYELGYAKIQDARNAQRK